MDLEAFYPAQTPLETSIGTCALPIHYRDGSLVALFWRIDPALASTPLHGTPFEPLVIAGKALALLVAFEYRDTSIGAYNEIGLAVWAQIRGSKPSGLGLLRDPRMQEEQGVFIINLPVTTDAAWTAGRELWGYPKYVAPIRTSFRADRAEAILESEFQLRVPHTGGIRLKGMPFVILSLLGGRILRTVVEVDHRVRWSLGRGVQLRLLGDGPTAQTVRSLGLDRSRPALVFRTDRMRSFLPLGKDVGSARENDP